MIITIDKPHHATIEIKKSKFIAYVFPIQTEAEAKEAIQSLKKEHFKARHHCSAYRLMKDGLIEHSSDDGEPSGTAGRPMLERLRHEQLVNVLVVVVRYFGGIKLGTGGLSRAYGEAVQNALYEMTYMEQLQQQQFKVTLPYDQYDKFCYFLNQQSLFYDNISYHEAITLDVYCDLDQKEAVLSQLTTNFPLFDIQTGTIRTIMRPLL